MAISKNTDFWLAVVGLLCALAMCWTAPNFEQALFDLSLGIFVSLLIYALVAWWPERRKKQAIQGFLNDQYANLQDGLIPEYLSACGESYDETLIVNLKRREQFTAYFKSHNHQGQDRWGCVVVGFRQSDDRRLKLIMLLKRFQVELDLCVTLSSVNIEGGGFAGLRKVSHKLRELVHALALKDDEGIKTCFRFLWTLHTGWSFETGYSEGDIIRESLGQI